MRKIFNNEFKSELIFVGARPNVGKTALLIKIAKDFIAQDKKVLFFSLDSSSELLLKRMNIEDTNNLLIKDEISDISQMSNTIQDYKPDIVLIDYLQLLPDENELFTLLKQNSDANNIPIVVTSQLSRKYDNLDLSQINLQELFEADVLMSKYLEMSDTLSILYEKEHKVILYKEIKNTYGTLKEIDIREILN